MKTLLLIASLLAMLVGAIAFAVITWTDLSGVSMSIHGWIALIGGAVLSLLVGGGLMTLVFYSARRGYDDAHHEAQEEARKRWNDVQDD